MSTLVGVGDRTADGVVTAGAHPRARTRDAAPAVGRWVTLTTGERSRGGHEPVRVPHVLLRVGIAAVVVAVVVAVVGGLASRRTAERQAVNDAARTTDLLADVAVQPALDDGLLTGSQASLARLDRVVRQRVLTAPLVRVKIWTSMGRIVYSDEPRLIGRTFSLDEDELAALRVPRTRAEITDLHRPENRYERDRGKLLEVYRPVWTPRGQPLLFETYAQYSTVRARTSQLWRGFAGITLSSLLLLLVLLAPVLWTLLHRLRRAQTQREALLRHALDASLDERRRVAATLHDGVVQDLAGTSFTVASTAETLAAAGHVDVANRLGPVAAVLRSNIGSMRSLLVDIYPPSLRSAGLPGALTDLAGSLRNRNVEVHFDVPTGPMELDPEDGQLVFRVAQECLRNVVKHAAADRVDISLTRREDSVVLEITDDGVGFDVDDVLTRAAEGHYGLRLLTDVAAHSGATLQVGSAPGAGTRWRLTLRPS